MQVLVFCDFGLKTPIHAPFWRVFGAQFPQKNVTHRPNAKNDRPFGRTTSFEPLSVNIGRAVRVGRWDEKTRTHKEMR